MNVAPTAVRNVREAGRLILEWERPYPFSHARLRQACPCSQCRAARLRGQTVVVADDVRVVRIELQGYGIQLVFSDGHDRGIYPWAYLRGLEDVCQAP